MSDAAIRKMDEKLETEYKALEQESEIACLEYNRAEEELNLPGNT